MSSTREPSDGTPGIHLTEKAADAARTIFDEEGLDPEDTGLRVIAREKQCNCGDVAYGLDLETQSRQNDHTLTRRGVQLVVDERSLDHLDDVTLDYVDDVRGQGFTIETAKSGCGCGHSH